MQLLRLQHRGSWCRSTRRSSNDYSSTMHQCTEGVWYTNAIKDKTLEISACREASSDPKSIYWKKQTYNQNFLTWALRYVNKHFDALVKAPFLETISKFALTNFHWFSATNIAYLTTTWFRLKCDLFWPCSTFVISSLRCSTTLWRAMWVTKQAVRFI